MQKDYANFLLKKTKDDYNRIADKFSSTRGYLSEDILILKKYAKPGDKILDLGCGNGRLSELFSDKNIRLTHHLGGERSLHLRGERSQCVTSMSMNYTGVDFSKELITIARKKYPSEKFYLADALKLPFLQNRFDAVYCLSVFHHIPSEEFRVKFLKEIRRVLAPNGKVVLTVWNLRSKEEIKLTLFKNFFSRILGLSKLDGGDVFLPFKSEGTTVQRYIHCFTSNELEKLLAKTGFKVDEIKILNRGKKAENANILIVGKK